MFTGIVEERGEVRAMAGHRLTVACRVVPTDSDIGASIAVNGVCLTVVGNDGASLAFDLSDETIDRTSLRRLAEGHAVNLERPVTLAARLGGHIVQGHVDGVGEVQSVEPGEDGGSVIRFRRPRRPDALRDREGLDLDRRHQLDRGDAASRRRQRRGDPAHPGRHHAWARPRPATR